ncbi:POTRA domain-containing protein [Hymenobacter psoromatis]|uniref:POTRA domain-containing protein n=1 Tax=Hymenobacter psoromatis TaxID=1484116 RepID=UPI001CBAABFA|nr:POTRA domain-containing protein [Hymenobacter psoromatis]
MRAQSRIGTITWLGHHFLSAAQLTRALGLKPSDAYSKEALDAKLNYWPDNSDFTSRYMNQGYLFFALSPVAKTQADGTTDLLFTLHEGPTAQVDTITVKSNRKIATADILRMLPLHQGELFSRAKLIQSQRVLTKSGFFDPTKIAVNPQPDPARGLVNVGFVVVEK